jgi:lipoprotein-anchoring transpeptidase ErfK/SrfK
MKLVMALTLASLGSISSFASEPITPEAVQGAQLSATARPGNQTDALIVKAQILLDRAGFSPGEIDGKRGENFRKAVKAFAQTKGISDSNDLTPEIWAKLNNASEPILTTYQITKRDVAGPFLEKLPAKMEDMKEIKALGYTSPAEALAERFHMSEELLSGLNGMKKSYNAGDDIHVVNVVRHEKKIEGAWIEVDKTRQTVTVRSEDGQIHAFYPATVGSDEKPSPEGVLKITGIRKNPTYRYDPAFEFKGVRSTKPFVIQPGPNNPVGTTWIALSAKSYGIHGTPHPNRVSKSESNGCVRLTNWDAAHLSKLVGKGTEVRFIDNSADSSATRR